MGALDGMNKVGAAIGAAFAVGIVALVWSVDPGAYHMREFESVNTNVNKYRPSLGDRLKGIRDIESKWAYHLRKLEQLGVVEHTNLVFTAVPYTHESSKRIWRAAYSNYAAGAVMLSAKSYSTNDPG